MCMTRDELVAASLDMLRVLMRNRYCEDLIAITLDMLTVVPRESKEYAILKFTEIAKQGLPEVDFHYEISQVFKEIMGYESSPTEIRQRSTGSVE